MQVPETEIIVRKDGAEILRKTVRPGDYVIGREEGCDVCVDVDLVSRRHAQLTVNFDHALIEDLGSSNGTQVNGKPVTESTRLWPNQKIQIGAAVVEIRRLKTIGPPDVSLAPQTAAVQRLLPEEFLKERKYDIGGVVAQGGMGAILNAQEASIQRTVAMKVVLDGSSPDDLARFVAEARVTGQLEHPNIVPVHELGVDENEQPFYTMKFVRGITLRKVLELMADGNKGTVAKYQLTALLTIFQKVCDAIAFAHSRGVIHRDLKPENIMLDDFGVVLVMDWGLAKRMKDEGGGMKADGPAAIVEETHSHSPVGAGNSTDTYATMAGAVMGTPQYMAPEQARGEVETLDARADIYALGAILYHILALRPSVAEGEAWEVVAKVADGEIDPLITTRSKGSSSPSTVKGDMSSSLPPKGNPGRKLALPHLPGGRIPDSLAAVVRQAMAFDKEQRYTAVADLQADLTAYQNGFATGAEHASLMKQILLLIKRNKGVFVTAFAAWMLITAVVVWFVIHLRASEQETRRQAEIAKQNEAQAVEQREEARKALAKSALALAEAARRESNSAEMEAALNDVPEDLRDSTWQYLLSQSDTSVGRVHFNGTTVDDIVADPKRPGVFALLGNNGKVQLVDIHSDRHVLEFPVRFPPNASGAFHLAWSPDGERIAIARGATSNILIHNARDGTKLAEWEAPPSKRLEFSPDGSLLLQTVGDESALLARNAATGELRWKYEPEGRNARAAFTPDSQHVVTYGGQDHLRLVSAKDGLLERPLTSDSLTVFAVRPDGRTVVCVRTDARIESIVLEDHRVAFEFRPQDRPITHLAFTPDGTRLVTGVVLADGRQALQVWDAITGALMENLLGGSGSMWDLGVHPLSGELLVAGPTSRVWNFTGVPEKWILHGGNPGMDLTFWGSDDLVIGPGPSASFGLQRLQAGSPVTVWKPEGSSYQRLTVSADGKVGASVKGGDNVPVVVVRNPGPNVEQVSSFKAGKGSDGIRLSPTGDRLASAEAHFHRINIFDVAKGTQLLTLEGTKEVHTIWDMKWLAGGARFVALVTVKADRGNPGSEEWVMLWDTSTGKLLQKAANRTAMEVLAISPDGSRFAEAGADKWVRIRDSSTLAIHQQFRAHDGPIVAIAWHPSKPVIATSSTDLSIRLWDAETGRRLEELRGPLRPANGLAFSPTGRRLAAASSEGKVRVWEPRSINEQAVAKQENGEWTDLLAPLTETAVSQTGNGWRLENGALFSPTKSKATLPLGPKLAGASYQLRVKLREFTPKESFNLALPVGDQMVGFVFDGWPSAGFFTSLNTINNKEGKTTPEAVHGKIVKNSEDHELEVTVQLDGANLHFTALFDGQPLYEWTGPIASLAQSKYWNCSPGNLYLGSNSADWMVSEVKLKKL